MRQTVDHPYLVMFSKRAMEDLRNGDITPAITLPPTQQGQGDGGVTGTCVICEEEVEDKVVSSCCPDNAFCRKCVVEFMETAPEGTVVRCPGCREPFSIDLTRGVEEEEGVEEEGEEEDGDEGEEGGVKKRKRKTDDSPRRIDKAGTPELKELGHVPSSSILRRINLNEFTSSSKIEVLTSELLKMRRESPGSKAIVFSQFVNFLDLVRWRLHSDPFLQDLGLGVRTLQGSMKVQDRDTVLREFREDLNVRVLLISLKAGGVALNLTNANHIFLCDPWWNPAAEMQAIDRTHRLGQRRAIKAVRLVCQNTVEERILELQEKKRLVFDGTVGGDARSLQKLGVEDMANLFR